MRAYLISELFVIVNQIRTRSGSSSLIFCRSTSGAAQAFCYSNSDMTLMPCNYCDALACVHTESDEQHCLNAGCETNMPVRNATLQKIWI